MKSFYLDNTDQIRAYKRLGRPLFMPEEIVFFEVNPKLSKKDLIEAFSMFSRTGNQLYLKITTKKIEHYSFLSPYLKGHCLKITSPPNQTLEVPFIEILLNENNIEEFLTLKKESFNSCRHLFIDPGSLSFEHLKRVQELLKSLASLGIHVDFSYEHPFRNQWDAKCLNTLRGPLQVDIDLSNGCTHNCQFCGLYADSVVDRQKKENGGSLSNEVLAIQRAKIPTDKVLEIIDGLSLAVERITFGGAGDPYTHGDIHKIIKHARSKGISVKTFTNFAYISEKDIDELHALANDDLDSLAFIINLSGATPETYVKTRPNQNHKAYEKVTSMIRYASDLIKRDGKGFYMTLMCVTTKDNFHEMPNFVALSKELGCQRLWIKPMEIHDAKSMGLLIPKQQSLEYALKARLTLHLARSLGVEIFEKEILERIVESKKEEIERQDGDHPLSKQVKELIAKDEVSFRCLTDQNEVRPIHSYRVRYSDVFEKNPDDAVSDELDDTAIRKGPKFWKENFSAPSGQTPVSNSDLPTEVYNNQPCYIGYNYLRLHVNGKTTPCCSLELEVGNYERQSLGEIQESTTLKNFKEKMLTIHEKRFHSKEKMYSVCNQCPHLFSNRLFHQLKNRN